MRNLVMGVAKGYGWDMLEPFVTSFAKNCQSAELVLFVDDISAFNRDRLIQAGVLLKTFPDDLKSGIPSNTRWKIFSDFLETHGDAYEQIFITDTRDVIFQNDIFATFGGLKSYLGYATEEDDIGGSKTGEKVNYDWLVGCFGEETADKLRDKKIICCGTIIGTTAEMKIFCHELWKILEHKTADVFDQAVTNYLVYNDLLPIKNLIEIDNCNGAIYTNGLIKNNKIRGDKVLRGDGGIPTVVHQYDRHKDLINLVDETYRDNNFQADLRFNDMRSVTEQATCLLFANKIGDAARLFMKKFIVTKDFGGCERALIRLWEIAMKNPLSQATELLELSAQMGLKSVENLSAREICVLLNYAAEYRRPVDHEFKNYVTSQLLKIAEEKFLAGEHKQYLSCLELIVSIEGGKIYWVRK